MQREILDTQIISYAQKGQYEGSVVGKSISSITAMEFLLMNTSSNVQGNYYVPNRIKSQALDFGWFQIDHPFSKNSTDQMIFDLGQEYSTIIIFGNNAITKAINERAIGLYRECIRFLEKSQQKLLKKRFRFLLDNQVSCIPVSLESADLGCSLFIEFGKTNTFKRNLRNSLNDVLILATCINESAKITTEDNLLSRFAAKKYNGEITSLQDKEILEIKFNATNLSPRKINHESKGYINKSWQVKTRKALSDV